jgi:hypothetical protein
MNNNGAIGASISGAVLNSNSIANSQAGWAIHQGSIDRYPAFGNNMIVFKGLVEVEKAANGFVVRIATRQGDIATTYVAKDVSEVNGIITAEMVKFKLEDK